MKAEKVLGIVACAVACAASVNAFADQVAWFDGKVSTTTSGAISTPEGASWSNATSGVTFESGKIVLDNDGTSPLALVPSGSQPALSDNVVTISSTAVLTPSDVSDLGDVEGAKAGFAVGVDGANTNFYGYASGLAAGSRWVKLTGEVPQGENATTTFSIVLDYRTGKQAVKFFFGGAQLSSVAAPVTNEWAISATGLDSISAYGSGSLTALSATCEKAVVAIGTVKYGSVADAVADGGTASTILDVSGSGVISGSATASNGLPMAVCNALGLATDNEAANIVVAPAPADTSATHITLAVNVADAPEGSLVKYVVSDGSTSTDYENAEAVLVPLAAGTYRITPALK